VVTNQSDHRRGGGLLFALVETFSVRVQQALACNALGPDSLVTLFALVSVIALALAPPIAAEVVTSVTVDAYNTIGITEDDTTAAGLARGEVDFESRGSDVRSRLQLRAFVTSIDGVSTSVLTVPRAEIRWRMYAGESYRMRFTVGRSRLSWGDGVLYNAGDTINGAAPGSVDFTADTLRDETQWIAAGYFPLGRFAFFEPVVLVPGFDLDQTYTDTNDDASTDDDASADDDTSADDARASTNEPSSSGAISPFGTASSVGTADPAWHTGAGGRVQFKLAEIKTELGYLYRGEEEIHQPSISLQGNLFLDWYLGASLRLPDPPDEAMFVSGGLLYNGNHRRLGAWSVRTEALWDQSDEALAIFPEITWSPSQLFTLFLRSQTEPIEDATWNDPDETVSVHTLGFSWLPTTGLTLSLYGSVATVRDRSVDDASGTTEPTGTFTAAVRYTF
jgi:hypothetical protein